MGPSCIYTWSFVKGFFLHWCASRAMASSVVRFLDHTQRLTAVGRTPLDEWSSRRRDLYLKTHNPQQTKSHALGAIWTHNLCSRSAAGLRLRPPGHLVLAAFVKYIFLNMCILGGPSEWKTIYSGICISTHTHTHKHTKPPCFEVLISRYVCRHAYPIQYIIITTDF